ncbi:hypothetical protein AURDEDRAFT_127872 [Auricularia subglabra TFB-10046 SS5]|nr:hypothetical protein AURDEDRAFT_127872 [Auricularia subglabra TFB-10046 SS5]
MPEDLIRRTLDWPNAPLIKKLAIGFQQKHGQPGLSLLRGGNSSHTPGTPVTFSVAVIQEQMLNVENLTIEGGPFSLEELLPALKNLPRLITLALPELTDLVIGRTAPGSERALEGMGEPQRERHRRAKKVSVDRVKTAVIAAIPRLKYLWIGQCDLCDFTRRPLPSSQAPQTFDPFPTMHGVAVGIGGAPSTTVIGWEADELDQLEPIYVPPGESTWRYTREKDAERFSL